jgi:hypothetical protein
MECHVIRNFLLLHSCAEKNAEGALFNVCLLFFVGLVYIGCIAKDLAAGLGQEVPVAGAHRLGSRQIRRCLQLLAERFCLAADELLGCSAVVPV